MTFHNHQDQIIKGIGEEIVKRLQAKGYSFGHLPDPLGFADSITPVDVEGIKEVFLITYVRKVLICCFMPLCAMLFLNKIRF